VELVKMQFQDAVNTANTYKKIIHCLRKVRADIHITVLSLGELSQGIYMGVRGGRVVHGASDVSELQACNQCLSRVWVRSQLAALDKLHRIKGIFSADHVPVVSSEHFGFLHHQN
jgi:hypothetical protein